MKPTYEELVAVIADAEDRLQAIVRMCREGRDRPVTALDCVEARAFYGRQFKALNDAGYQRAEVRP
jgi:chemotaxis regulatin CheY-phosphate phosphatase CheZ